MPAYSTYAINKDDIARSVCVVALACQLDRYGPVCEQTSDLEIQKRLSGFQKWVPGVWYRKLKEKSSLKFVLCHISVHLGENAMTRKLLSLAAIVVAAFSIAMSGAEVQAGKCCKAPKCKKVKCCKQKSCCQSSCQSSCCAPRNNCCAPRPTCCAPAPTCCAPAPSCCAPGAAAAPEAAPPAPADAPAPKPAA